MIATRYGYGIAILPAFILLFSGARAAPDDDDHALRNRSTQWMNAVTFDSGKKLPYYGTRSLNEADTEIRTVLLVIPGGETNGPKYFQAALESTQAADRFADTAVVALQFQTGNENPRRDELYWTGEWQQGADSLDGSETSSFEVLDEVLELAVENFPNAEAVVLAGHSSGGQIINRYAALGSDIADNDKITFVVMNPSTYVYVDDRRVRADGKYGRPQDAARECPGFNTWKYGLDKLPRYAAGLSQNDVLSRMFRRNVVFMPGLNDVEAEGVDTNCAAMYQGNTRIERTRNYWGYIQTFPEWKRNARLVEVPGIGHAGAEMLKSTHFRDVVFSTSN